VTGAFAANRARTLGLTIVVLTVAAAVLAPVLGPHAPGDQHSGLLNAPPTLPHVVSDDGTWHRPFIYKSRLVDRLEQRFEEDRSTRVPLAWFTRGHLVVSSDEGQMPLLLLGADSFGRDVWSRLLFGARASLGIAVVAAIGAMVLGAVAGGLAGYAGGAADDLLMRGADFIMVLPAMYVVLALRAVLPLVLAPATVFVLLTTIFAIVGAPFMARGIRGIVRTERGLDYAAAARALGASDARIVFRHLLPAARGFIGVEMTLLMPAFVVAEATLSYIGLGFPEPIASWGTMLHDASNVRVFVDFPWLLSPALAMFAVVLGLNLTLQGRTTGVESVR
jgi:peptide/nickel transport system permease protein